MSAAANPTVEPDAARHELPQPRKQGLVYWTGWFLSRTIGLVWMRLWPKGTHHIPKTGPVILVANHQSHLDPPLLGCCCPRPVTFIARGTLARGSLMRWLLPRMGTLLVHREAPAKSQMQTALNVLRAGGCIGLFPEGTRTEDGQIHGFQGGVQFLARRSKATVVPVGLNGSGRSMGRGKSWPRPAKVTMNFGAPWSAADLKAPDALERLRGCVAQLSGAPLAPPAAAHEQNQDTPESSDGGATAVSESRDSETRPQDGPAADLTRSGAPAGSGRSTTAGEGG